MKLSGQEFQVSELDKISEEIYELEEKRKMLEFELNSEYESDKYQEQRKMLAVSGAKYNMIAVLPITMITLVCAILLIYNIVSGINSGFETEMVIIMGIVMIPTVISAFFAAKAWRKQFEEMRDADSQVDKKAEIKARLRSQISSIDIKLEALKTKKKELENVAE